MSILIYIESKGYCGHLQDGLSNKTQEFVVFIPRLSSLVYRDPGLLRMLFEIEVFSP